MRFTKTQAWQHLANKNREGEGDLVDKFRVIDILRTHFGLYGLTGEILMIDDQSCRLPDILVKGHTPIVVELDGPVHGEPDMPNDKTEDRNKDYSSIGVKLVIINKEATMEYDTNMVIKVLEDNGLKRIAKTIR